MNQRDELEQLCRSVASTLDVDMSDLPEDVEDPKVPVIYRIERSVAVSGQSAFL